MNAVPAPSLPRRQPASPDGGLFLSQAGKRGLQRMLQALFREQLLQRAHLISEGGVSWLPLWSQQAMLRIEGLHIGRIGDCRVEGAIAYYRTGQAPQAINTPSALLACIAPALPGRPAPSELARLIEELDNSFDNDVLCLRYRQTWAQELAAGLDTGRSCFIDALRHGGHSNPALLLEQWGTLGHPWHPTFKTKLGLSPDEVMALSPEFRPVLQVPVAAIRADRAHAAFAESEHPGADPGNAYRAWFARTFPAAWQRWDGALRAAGKEGQAWLPLPLHPYQASRQVPHGFAPEIARGELLLLPGVTIDATPTMSFRTVVPEGSPSLPHMKLPVALRLTSVQRTVSPKSAVMGPRLTRLLGAILEREGGFGGALAIVPENVGLHYLDPDGNDDRARHLAILYRGNPMAAAGPGLFPVPVGALFADSPFSGRLLATELVSLARGDHAQGALDFFTQYAATVLRATLSAYLLYGIAFEAHQQNSFILLDARHAPVRLLARDFGDLRVHGPTLRAAGLALDAYRPGHTVYEDDEPVRDKLLHAVLLCHLVELALLLAHAYRQPEAGFWNLLRREVEQVFDSLRGRADERRWERERRALLEEDWPAKSFLRMRLLDTSDDLHGSMPNPFTAQA